MDENEKYARARAKVQELKGFYTHLVTYILVNLGLFVVNLATSPQNWWFYYVTIFWGIGLAVHAIILFRTDAFLGADWEKKKIKEYVERNDE